MRELEQQFPDDLTVVGVHSGKYTAERETAHVRDASIRLGATHPTLNDRQFRVWRSYAVSAWPTLVAIDPRGYVVGMHAGEFSASALVPFVERVIAGARKAEALEARPLSFAPDPPTAEPGILAFPGKLAVADRRIAVADSGHHRVLVGSLDEGGTHMLVERIIGGDAAGCRNGDEPLFHNPQGIVFAGDTLYVADAGNHSIRAITIATGAARTVAGTGQQARTTSDLAAGAMSSPWDIVLDGDTLFVAMAGIHQLWTVDLLTGRSEVHCGSGAEALHDGSHSEAALAQPMGVCIAGDTIYFTDSESSAVRIVDRGRSGGVSTIVGTGLFDFGDIDGLGDVVRLQHPQGIALASDGRLLVADSYNGALKWIDRDTHSSETWIRGLHEPAGVALTEQKGYVADTDLHRIAVVDRATSEISTLTMSLRAP